MEDKKKFKVVTLGCRTNQYESQAYTDQLLQVGYAAACEGERADICIVNTCTVTAGADRSSRHAIRSLARENPGAQILVTGCLAERSAEEVGKIEGVSQVISNKDKESLLSLAFPETEFPEFAIQHFEAHTRAFVKVQDGCNSFCTYCIIPYVRGRSRSRRKEDVLREVEGLIAGGFKEIVITGINVGDYDGNPREGEAPVRLAELVRAVDQLEGLERLRLSSIDPDEVDEELLSAITEGKRTCPSMHLVLQSGSNGILKRMNRKYTREMFLQAVERLSVAMPGFTVTTDVIVGFPGESEGDFQETLDCLNAIPCAKVHLFPYSPRPRTRAALYPHQVSHSLLQERGQRLLRAAEKRAFALRETYVGRRLPVLFESGGSGYTDNFLSVVVEGSETVVNTIREVELIENRPEALMGRIVS